MTIQVRDVNKRFGSFVALEDVTLDVPAGSLTALLGPSGSGKSTLLRVIAGLEPPDTGTVLLEDRDVTRVSPQDRGVGFVFQHYAAFRHMTVWDNVAFGLQVRKRPKAEIRERVDELLALVQLEGFSRRYPSQLSGGQRQRMALARALAVRPSVLLLDEPFGALDARVRKELRDWLRRLHDEVHVTTVLVTHDQEEAMDVADRVVVMDHGRLQQVGSPRELYEQPANAFVMSFIGPVNHLDGAFVRPHDMLIHPTRTRRQRPFARSGGRASDASGVRSSRRAAPGRWPARVGADHPRRPGRAGTRAAPAGLRRAASRSVASPRWRLADLHGRVVAFLEARRATELADLIDRHGGVPLAAPCLREVHAPDSPELQQAVQRVCDVRPRVAIFLTGVGTSTVFDAARHAGLEANLLQVLDAATVVVRGPKPAAVLRKLGVRIDILAPPPHTTVRGPLVPGGDRPRGANRRRSAVRRAEP